MADYDLIFLIFLTCDVAISLRASALWPRILALLGRRRNDTHVSLTDIEPLSGLTLTTEESKSKQQEYRKLLTSYLIVYLLATLSDWLQGPYVYALYDAYGYTPHEIAILFVAGFGSSMIFGSFVGGLADSCGRKKFVLLFCLIYGAGCLTKHFRDFKVLMLGRLLGGIATSLLFSVFDTWYIKAHNTSPSKLDKSLIGSTFSCAAFGNSIIAIVAGLVANQVANGSAMVSYQTGNPFQAADYVGTYDSVSPSLASKVYVGGFIGPFDVAFAALVACFVMASWLWKENYGEQPASSANDVPEIQITSSHSSDGNDTSNEGSGKESRRKGNESISSGWRRAWQTVISDPQVLLCGLITSLFEGSMYVFVFMWTRSLKSLTPGMQDSGGHRRRLDGGEGGGATLPFGLIFSTFMVCCMAGSSLFSIWMEKKVPLEDLAIVVFAISSGSMLVVALSSSDTATFLSMNIFEVCVGMYFPTMGTLKSTIVPEHSRSAIYNLYRIPLNAIVLTSLLTDLSVETSFFACAAMLAIAVFLQVKLRVLRQQSDAIRSTTRPGDMSAAQERV